MEQMFIAEYAKSNRSSCKSCGGYIAKEDLRMGAMTQSTFHDGLTTTWFHETCFWSGPAAKRMKSEDEIKHFENLRWHDQESIRDRIKPSAKTGGKKRQLAAGGHSDLEPSTKRMNGGGDEESSEKLALRKQTEDTWRLRDQLSLLTLGQLKELLTTNNQELPKGKDKFLDRLTDCMLFGALEKCTECDNGQLVYSTTHRAYICLGHISGFTRCQFSTNEPRRAPFVIPNTKYAEKHLVLATYVYHPRNRVIPNSKRETAAAGTSSRVPSASAMSGMNLSQRLDYSTMMSVMAGRRRSTGGPAGIYGKSNMYKSNRTTQKVELKNGAAVDPDFEFAPIAHVHQDESKNLYNAILGKADVQNGSNSFYKLQLLKHDSIERYWLFRSWGRVGTTIGGKKTDDYGAGLHAAIHEFKRLFLEKTGNHWDDRHNFLKQPYLMNLIDVDYIQGAIESPKTTIKPGSRTTLAPPVQNLLKMIFDVDRLQETMKEFEIDLTKMPLGKLSKNQIRAAYEILTGVERELNGYRNAARILDCSNRFFTLIPHDFGMERPPLLDNMEIIKEKVEMLDNLLQIECAYSIVKVETGDRDPLDAYYDKLKTDIQVLDKSSEEFFIIDQYVKNTHASTHMLWDLELEEVFVIKRQGESERYAQFKNLHNRMLLWHGSRVTNYVGILSQGLRIAPPEAPMTGYMFGKGVYFADRVSKSAGYCWPSPINRRGLMLLCEVALGNMQEYKKSIMVQKLPPGLHSVKGVGIAIPDPAGQRVLADGTIVPMGTCIDDRSTGAKKLLYNEYIVYDESQVNIKYLLKMNFKYRF